MKLCEHCGKEFVPRRPHQKYCVVKCRAAAWVKNNPEKRAASQRAYTERNSEKLKVKHRAWRERNSDRVRARNRAWWKENPDYHCAWRKKNPEKRAASQRAWAARNSEQVKAHIRSWRKANPERVRAIVRRRRVRVLSATGSHTTAQWNARIEYYGGRCCYCGKVVRDNLKRYHPNKLTQEHLIPLAKGGTNFASNLAPACWRCNSDVKKAHISLLEMKQRMHPHRMFHIKLLRLAWYRECADRVISKLKGNQQMSANRFFNATDRVTDDGKVELSHNQQSPRDAKPTDFKVQQNATSNDDFGQTENGPVAAKKSNRK